MRAARGRRHDAAIARDEFAILEHILGRGEHRFAVGVLAIHGDIGGGPRVQAAALAQAEQACRRGAREDRDFIEREFAGHAPERRLLRHVGMEPGKLVVAE